MTSAVTAGLPSRSLPIHEPQRRNAGTRGGRVPLSGRHRRPPRTRPRGRLVEGRIDGAEQARHGPEQRLVEEREGRPDLVERARGHGSQVGGPPQERDLLAKAPAQVAIVGGRQVAIVEPGEQPVDAPEREEERAAPGFGRMGGQDRRDPEAADQAPRHRSRGTCPRKRALAHRRHDRRDRVAGRPAPGRRASRRRADLTPSRSSARLTSRK